MITRINIILLVAALPSIGLSQDIEGVLKEARSRVLRRMSPAVATPVIAPTVVERPGDGTTRTGARPLLSPIRTLNETLAGATNEFDKADEVLPIQPPDSLPPAPIHLKEHVVKSGVMRETSPAATSGIDKNRGVDEVTDKATWSELDIAVAFDEAFEDLEAASPQDSNELMPVDRRLQLRRVYCQKCSRFHEAMFDEAALKRLEFDPQVGGYVWRN